MNINKVLFRETKNYFSRKKYLFETIGKFLLTSPKCKEKAFKIIRQIMLPHGKEGLLPHMVRLAKIEYKIGELQPELRDHVVHAVLSFILGVYLKENFFQSVSNVGINDFQWEVASLFHDVAYPFEIAGNVGSLFVQEFKNITEDIGISSPDIKYVSVITGLEKLTDGNNGIDLIQVQLEKWGLKIDAKKEYERNRKMGKICHGIMSSLAILNIIDRLYKRFNPQRDKIRTVVNYVDWNQKHFEKDIIPACSAIFVHNLPSESFVKTKIRFNKSPLAFLLKLSDCLQEWERPSLENKRAYPSSQFDIKVNNDQLVFTAGRLKEKIENDFFSCLNTNGIKIKIL